MGVLRNAVELESLDAVILDQVARLASSVLALVRIDAGEGDADVVILGGNFGDLVIGDALGPHAALAIDGEHAKGDIRLAIKLA